MTIQEFSQHMETSGIRVTEITQQVLVVGDWKICGIGGCLSASLIEPNSQTIIYFDHATAWLNIKSVLATITLFRNGNVIGSINLNGVALC